MTPAAGGNRTAAYAATGTAHIARIFGTTDAKNGRCRTPKNLRFDARQGTNMPYDSPTPNLTRQLQRLVTEERPGACVGCGFEHNCRRDGCAALRKVSRIVAREGERR